MVARSEVPEEVWVKRPKKEKTLSMPLALQFHLGESESIPMRLVPIQGAVRTMQGLPEEADRAVEGVSSLVAAEVTGAVMQAVHVVGQGAEAVGTTDPLPTAAISTGPLTKTIKERDHLADMAREALNQTLDVPGTTAKPEVRAQSMKKCRKEGGKGALKRAARVLLVTLHTLTRRITSQLPRKEQEERI